MPKQFDVVVWGATGFTGQLVAKYLAQHGGKGLRWAICGRNATKLNKVRDDLVKECGISSVDILTADSEQQATVDNVVKQTEVMISTAGPFLLCGTPIIDACVRLNVDYVDITGETPWVRKMIDEYHTKAQDASVTIVPMSGFDSLPSDLGCWYVSSEMQKLYGEKTKKITNYVAMTGTFSGGTLYSGLTMDKMGLRDQLENPLLLGSVRNAPLPEEADGFEALEVDLGVGPMWTGPFMMAPMNTRVVRRSHFLTSEAGNFSRAFTFNERQLVQTERQAKGLSRALSTVPTVEAREKKMQAGQLPKPGEGPSAERRAKSTFTCIFVAESESDRKLYATISGGDPGYDETAKMVAESALTLLDARRANTTPRPAGVLTGSTAHPLSLVSRLQAAGIRFKTHTTFAEAVSQIKTQAKL